jgi:ribosomal protein L11 methylase PrmA
MDKIKVLFFYLQPKDLNFFKDKKEEWIYIYKSFITFFLLYKTYYVGFINANLLIIVFKDFEFLKNKLKLSKFILDFLNFADKFKYKFDFFVRIFYSYVPKDFIYQLIIESEENIKQDIFSIIKDINIKDGVLKEDINNINIYLSPIESFSEGTGSHFTTKLMLNNLYKTISNLKQILNSNKELIVIDYGSGTGILTIAILKILYYLLPEVNTSRNIRIFSIDIDFKACLESKKNIHLNLKSIKNYNFENYFICSFSIDFLRKALLSDNPAILLANVPFNVLKTLFIYNYDFFIISGIKSEINLFKNEQFYKDLENKYHLEFNINNNWISLVGKNKITKGLRDE